MKGLRNELKAFRKIDFVWRYFFNLSPTLKYRALHGHRLDSSTQNLVDQLNRDGVAQTSAEELLGADPYLGKLYNSVELLLKEQDHLIEDLKQRSMAAINIGDKSFNLELLGKFLTVNATDTFLRFALTEKFRNIADAYLQMYSKLRYYNVWYTAATDSVARESQLWHFDREDNYIVKVFFYLDDVDENAGPFTYAPGTHRKGVYKSLKPEFLFEENVRRTTDDQMEAVYQRKNWRVCTGKKGTIIFADTRGYHKGGDARSKDRLMFTCMYTSPASQSKDFMRFPSNFDPIGLSREQVRALRIPRK